MFEENKFEQDKKYMERAIRLAKKGEGFCNPNPMVGAVIVKNNHIIGEGYHKKYGDLHAEREAIKALKTSAEGSTLYVTLEPCCHYGQTPPCTDAIIENKIKRVVIGSRDPNPKVNGKGVEILRKAGIKVVQDFMIEKCNSLNPVFFKYITTGLPYVIMKYAMTIDGKIATQDGQSRGISSESAIREVHKMRHCCMGIMVGSGTVLLDNPLLTCRLKNKNSPIRIICDRTLRTPLDSLIVKTAEKYKTILCCSENSNFDKKKKFERAGVKVLTYTYLKDLMEKLGKIQIDSILLEGGAILNRSALSEGIVDEIRVLISPKIFAGRGRFPVEGQEFENPLSFSGFKIKSYKKKGEDLIVRLIRSSD